MLPYPTLPVPERIARLRHELFAAQDSLCYARADHYPQQQRQVGAHLFQDLSRSLRRDMLAHEPLAHR